MLVRPTLILFRKESNVFSKNKLFSACNFCSCKGFLKTSMSSSQWSSLKTFTYFPGIGSLNFVTYLSCKGSSNSVTYFSFINNLNFVTFFSCIGSFETVIYFSCNGCFKAVTYFSCKSSFKTEMKIFQSCRFSSVSFSSRHVSRSFSTHFNRNVSRSDP